MRTTVLGGRERWGQRLVDYPPERAERYRRSGAWTDRPLAQRLHEIAARFPERPAVVTAAASVTYAELDRATDRIAVGLDALGLRPGDPVLFQATNRLETVYAWYGCLKAGLVPVATLAAHRAHEIGHISRKVGAVAHLVETGLSFDLVAFARERWRSNRWARASHRSRPAPTSSEYKPVSTRSTWSPSNSPVAPPECRRSSRAGTSSTGTTRCTTRGGWAGPSTPGSRTSSR